MAACWGRGDVDRDPQRFDHVGAAAAARDRAIPMLRDRHAARCDHDRRRGREVQRVTAVATGSARVDDLVEPVIDRVHRLAHRLGAGDNRATSVSPRMRSATANAPTCTGVHAPARIASNARRTSSRERGPLDVRVPMTSENGAASFTRSPRRARVRSSSRSSSQGATSPRGSGCSRGETGPLPRRGSGDAAP